MRFTKFTLIVLIGFVACFKPRRSPFDTNTPNGLIYQIQVQTAIRNSRTVVTPTLQAPPSGTYNTPQFITLSSETLDAQIYYTLDGTEPSPSSYLYTHPIGIWSLLGQTVTIKFIAIKEEYLNSAVVTTTVGTFQMPPLKTGQTNNYTQTGSDGDLQKGLSRGYTDNGNGTITDNTTGLVWQKCTNGQENDSSCSGTASTSNFASAENYCSSLQLAGKQWRVPTLLELETLIDF